MSKSKILAALITGMLAASVFAADTAPKSDTNKTAPAAVATAPASADAAATAPAKKPAHKHHKKHGHGKQEATTPEAGSATK